MRGNHLIRECRRRAGLTQVQLAERTGTTQPAIARLEGGHGNPTLHRLSDIAYACGLEIQVTVNPVDDAEWEMVVDNLRLPPAERVAKAVGAARLALALAPPASEHGQNGQAMSERTSPTYDPEPMLRALIGHGVRFVVIGGFTANYHGSVHVTFDLDITPDRSVENLDRLSAALIDLGARVRARGVEPLPFNHDGRSLARVDVWNLTTPHGDLDVSFTPAGTQGYADLHERSEVAEVLGVTIEVASLADIVQSKTAANRPKDHLTLPTLRRLLDEQT